MANTHKIKRMFPHRDHLTIGKGVDASKWRNKALLERQGYIEPISKAKEETTAPEPVKAEITPVAKTGKTSRRRKKPNKKTLAK